MSNNTTVIGNIAGDPELRYTPSGTAVANLRVADTPRHFNKQTNQWTDGETDWITVTVWNALAENVANSFKKGDRVIVIGRYVAEKYTDKTTGEEKVTRKLIAEEVAPSLHFARVSIEKVRSNGNRPAQGGAPAAPAQGNAGGGAGFASSGFADEQPF